MKTNKRYCIHMFNISNFANVTSKGFVICAAVLIGMYIFNEYMSPALVNILYSHECIHMFYEDMAVLVMPTKQHLQLA